MEDSTEEGHDSAQDIARAIKKSKKLKPRPTKRQRKGPVPRSDKGKRKVGWRAAEDQAVFRSEEEKHQKRAKWEQKIGKIATAFVKPIVKNAFGAQARKGTKLEEENVVFEKQVMLQPLIPLENAHISAQRGRGNMEQPIQGRGAKIKLANVFLPPLSSYHVIADF